MTVINKPIMCMVCKGYRIAGMFAGGKFDKSSAIHQTKTVQTSGYD